MALYKALRAGYPNKQVEIGEQFEYDGVPGSWMQPVDDAAKKAFAARFGADAEAKGEPELRRPIGAAPVGDPTAATQVVTLKARIAELEGQAEKDKARIAELEADVESLSAPAPQTEAPATQTEDGDQTLNPVVAAAMESRRSKRGS